MNTPVGDGIADKLYSNTDHLWTIQMLSQKWSNIREGTEENDICTLDLAWEVSNTDDGGDAGDTYQ